MSEFQPAYVLQLLQEAKSCIEDADDPEEAIQESPALLNLIQQLLILTLDDQQSESGDAGGSSQTEAPARALTPPPQTAAGLSAPASPTTVAEHVPFQPVDPDPSWVPQVLMPTASEELGVSAECSVCGMDGVKGTFFRRGFTCTRCIGQHRLLNRSEGGGQSASRLAMLAGHHYYASRCPTKECRGFVPATAPSSVSTATEGDAAPAIDSSPSILPSDVAYMVSYVPHPPVLSSSSSSTASDDVDICTKYRRRMLDQLRLMGHPSVLFLFSCGDDTARRRTFFVHEAATPIVQFAAMSSAGRGASASSPGVVAEGGSYSFFATAPESADESTTGATASPATSASPATPPRVDSSSTLDLSVGTLVHTTAGIHVPGQHIEWVRKVAFAGLDALQHLHAHHLLHGHCTPSHMYVDDHGTIKLKATIVGGLEWQHHVRESGEERFLPPEALLRSSQPASVAADLYMLGGTLIELLLKPFSDATAGDHDDDDRRSDASLGSTASAMTPVKMLQCAQSACKAEGSIDTSLGTFIAFLDGLVRPHPGERPLSATQALQHPVFTSLRVVNGIPSETMGATIIVRRDWDTTEGSGGESAAGSAYDLRRNRAVSWRADTKPFGDGGGDGALVWVPRGDDNQAHLSQFLAEHGPKFQVVRSARSSMTLYSLKSDPRRRRAASLVDRGGSPMASSATSVASTFH